LTHEEVINKLDKETVSYEVGLGVSGQFADIFRVSIKVETALYETAVTWLRDLVYGSEFIPERSVFSVAVMDCIHPIGCHRLQVTVAKIQQSLPEIKRDGGNVLAALCADLLFDETSTSRAGGMLTQSNFIPALNKELQESPEQVIADFENIRRYCELDLSPLVYIYKTMFSSVTDASGVRFSLTGNVLSLNQPRSILGKHFGDALPVSAIL
jgi:Zn-dependent M16 (insulinase) family peptidase